MTAAISHSGMLAATAADPAAIAPPSLPAAMEATPPTELDRALAAYRQAREAAACHVHARIIPLSERYANRRQSLGLAHGDRHSDPETEAALAAEYEAIRRLEDEHGRLLTAQNDAADAVMLVPVHDAAGLAAKFDVFHAEAENYDPREEWMAAIGADIYRLAERAV